MTDVVIIKFYFLFDNYISFLFKVFILQVFINSGPSMSSMICVFTYPRVLTVSMSEFTQREEFPIYLKEISSTDNQIYSLHLVYIFLKDSLQKIFTSCDHLKHKNLDDVMKSLAPNVIYFFIIKEMCSEFIIIKITSAGVLINY